ncbi:MAG: hypothetical protein F6K08_24220, partial [Okeania sp. SIO1H6]|nr:hypothetical protein [Okeania sp. SIO1H6]NET23591.1 hypothetical protein [Okeania sp. SIO1H5]NET78601.1 hypothetical protein [Okeania sp. SIO1F9]
RDRDSVTEFDRVIYEKYRSYSRCNTIIDLYVVCKYTSAHCYKYRTVHELVRYRLKSKLKVPRPLSIKQNVEEFEELKKTRERKS